MGNKGQAHLIGIAIIILILLAIPFIPQQQITFNLQNAEIISPQFIVYKTAPLNLLLEQFKTTTISNTKVDILIFNETYKDCALARVVTRPCIPMFNTTVWTTPTSTINVKVALQNGEYVAQIVSFIWDPNGFYKQVDRETFTFKVE
jgi:hypothetical protein